MRSLKWGVNVNEVIVRKLPKVGKQVCVKDFLLMDEEWREGGRGPN